MEGWLLISHVFDLKSSYNFVMEQLSHVCGLDCHASCAFVIYVGKLPQYAVDV